MSKLSVVFFGNELLATGVTTTAPTLRALIDAGYDIKAVVARNAVGASRKQRELEVSALAVAHGIPVTADPAEYKADVGVLAAFGAIIPQAIIDSFPNGIINIHPSLLPKHRGPTPIESVILKGEQITGVSIMGLVAAMDAGPLYAQQTIKLQGDDSKQGLADKLLDLGSTMIIDVLNTIVDGTASVSKQDDTQATIDERIEKQAGTLDLAKPAIQLEREIRAYLGWPGSRTTVAGRDVIVTAAHVSAVEPESTDKKTIALQTSDGYLCIDRLKPAGKAEMTAQAFLAGIRS